MFSLCNQFSRCICLSLSFSASFSSLLSLSLSLVFFALVEPLSIGRVGWRSTLGGLHTLLLAAVTVAILGDPEHSQGSLGAKRRRTLPYNQTGPKVAGGQLSQRECEDSWEGHGAWSETQTSVWVCDGLALCVAVRDQACFHDSRFQWNLFKWNQFQSNNGIKKNQKEIKQPLLFFTCTVGSEGFLHNWIHFLSSWIILSD